LTGNFCPGMEIRTLLLQKSRDGFRSSQDVSGLPGQFQGSVLQILDHQAFANKLTG
jgi:hypothetical protein